MSSNVQFETSVNYEPAWVRFNVSLKTPQGEEEAAFKMLAEVMYS